MAIIINIDVMLAKRKMSVTELAEKVGITMANISVLKNGKAKAIRLSTLEAICKALECQPGDILEYNRWKRAVVVWLQPCVAECGRMTTRINKRFLTPYSRATILIPAPVVTMPFDPRLLSAQPVLIPSSSPPKKSHIQNWRNPMILPLIFWKTSWEMRKS